MSRQEILADPAGAFPEVGQLLAGYFHQDWMVDRDDWEEVVDDYVAESPRRVVLDCAAELDGLLSAGLGDDELRRVLDELGCSLDPAAYRLSSSAWLGAVAARLAIEG